MERGWLRSVPLRIDGPVDRAAAERHVGEALPELGGDARRALALVEIAGRERAEVAAEMGIAREALADLLYRARKVLRRSMFPLSASGWCERAERMLSDCLDGVLEPPATARLDVHLRHCDRCVEHERRLAQAREWLVRGFLEAQRPAPGKEPAGPAAELRVVEPEEAPAEPPEEAPAEPPEEAPAEPLPEAELPAEPEAPTEPPAQPARTPEPPAQPARTPEPPAQPERTPEPPAQPERTPEPPAQPERTPEPPADRVEPPAIEPVEEPALPPAERPPLEPAAEAAPEPAEREALRPAEPPPPPPATPAPPPRRSLVPASFTHGSLVWASLHALALVLAIASLVITVLAAVGAIERVF